MFIYNKRNLWIKSYLISEFNVIYGKTTQSSLKLKVKLKKKASSRI